MISLQVALGGWIELVSVLREELSIMLHCMKCISHGMKAKYCVFLYYLEKVACINVCSCLYKKALGFKVEHRCLIGKRVQII